MMGSSGARQMLGALLILLLALTGAGRGRADESRLAKVATMTIAGFVVPICHGDPSRSQKPDTSPVNHDCCDICAVSASALTPMQAWLASPLPFLRSADDGAKPPHLALARRKTPRLSQGPPIGLI
ncbi:hypothetical protein SCD90_00055 [Terrihabitans sp. PJ23]|uniref:DUF2946 domain-containing protein n=2 Tax=Terrihabitans rhizophilus TaxID=3092662 RepID=A0ABU4RHX9_9HYPH|nr:hypothetical protein [Terrihabitans sp. PJ23]